MRTCVGCGRRAAKAELVRIAKVDDGVAIDRTGHARGRGAYVCSNVGCFDKAVRRSVLGRSLRSQFPAADLERLRTEFVS